MAEPRPKAGGHDGRRGAAGYRAATRRSLDHLSHVVEIVGAARRDKSGLRDCPIGVIAQRRGEPDEARQGRIVDYDLDRRGRRGDEKSEGDENRADQ